MEKRQVCPLCNRKGDIVVLHERGDEEGNIHMRLYMCLHCEEYVFDADYPVTVYQKVDRDWDPIIERQRAFQGDEVMKLISDVADGEEVIEGRIE